MQFKKRVFTLARYLSHGVELVGRDVALPDLGKRSRVIELVQDVVKFDAPDDPAEYVTHVLIVRIPDAGFPLFVEVAENDPVMTRATDEQLAAAHAAFIAAQRKREEAARRYPEIPF